MVNIRFEPAEQPLEGAELFEMLPLKRDQPLRMSVVRASVERLFATGPLPRYPGGRRALQRRRHHQIHHHQQLVHRQRVGGGKSRRSAQPRAVGQRHAAWNWGSLYAIDDLETAVNGQRRLLESNGLYLSTIHPVFDYDTEHQQINIRFEIDSGRRARFGPPVLLGDFKLDPEARFARPRNSAAGSFIPGSR